MDWDRKFPLERGPNEGGELIDEPNEAPNGECELPAACGDGPAPCDCDGPPPLPPPRDPNGNVGEMEKVEPPNVNDGPPPWPVNMP